MSKTNFLREPVRLKIGETYKLEIKKDSAYQVIYEDVSFLAYTSSPEVIVVTTNAGQKLKVSRYDVYEIDENN